MTAIPFYASSDWNINYYLGGTSYFSPICNGCLSKETVEAFAQIAYETAGTFSSYSVVVSDSSTDAPITARIFINGVGGFSGVTIPSSTTGIFQDLISTDTIISGDLVDFNLDNTSSSKLVISVCYGLFAAVADTIGKHALLNGNNSPKYSIGTSIYFNPISGDQYAPNTILDTGSSEEALRAQIYCSIVSKLQNLSVYIDTNTADDFTDFKTRINSADGTLFVSVATTLTGVFQDLINQDSLVSGDLIDYQINAHMVAGTIIAPSISTELLSTQNKSLCVLGIGGANMPIGSGTVGFLPIGGGANVVSFFESPYQAAAVAAGTFANLAALLSDNSVPTNSIVAFSVNAAPTALSLIIPGFNTGYFIDVIDTAPVAINDLMTYLVASGAGGSSIILDAVTMSFEIPTAPTTRIKDIIHGPGIVVRPR